MNLLLKRFCLIGLLTCVAGASLSQALGRDAGDAEAGEPASRRGAWQPERQDRSAYRDIIDFNIFRADRRRLAEQVDRERNPPKPDDPKPTRPEVAAAPADPDASWRLAGISHDAAGSVAFIENTSSGETVRIQSTQAFSKGEIASIDYETVVYTLDDEQRVIRVGETLVGERVAPTSSGQGSSASSTTSKSSKNLSAAERLKALRERRAQEQGGGAAAPAEPRDQEQGDETPDQEQADETPGQEPADETPDPADEDEDPAEASVDDNDQP